jgi:phosphoribosylaminoimidazole-succinocarboxamide synthase
MLNATKDICANWLIISPAPNVSIGKRCEPFKIEMVVRGNLTSMLGELTIVDKEFYVV